jgi:hypothetical protein
MEITDSYPISFENSYKFLIQIICIKSRGVWRMVSKNLIGDKYDKYRRFTYLFPRETASNDEKSSFVRYLIPLRLWN